MMQFDSIETRAITLVNDTGPVVTLKLTGNNDKPFPGRIGRLLVEFHGDYSSEIEIDPGPDCHPVGNIIGQIMQMGPVPLDGKGRKRLTSGLYADGQGGISAAIDSTTTNASGTDGQKDAAPLVINAGEGKGVYIVLYPSDNTMAIQDRVAGTTTDRVSIASVIAHLRRIPK